MNIEFKSEIIRMYIHAKKGVDIGGVKMPANEREWQMFRHAFQVAYIWWSNRD
jgi:hypothetical protein